jgi:hypothetical protein
MNQRLIDGPVAIGGIGGSGTRVVAEILRESGFYLGADVNSKLDNLWFTLLLKRPSIFKNKNTLQKKIFTGISIFDKVMKGNSNLTWREYEFLIAAIAEISVLGHDYLRSDQGLWPFRRALSMFQAKKNISSDSIGWGWKEPNTHIFIEYINKYFSRLRYIHVIRHGLDMAYSDNQAQLYNWGSLFGVEKPRMKKDIPLASLEYWIKANQKAIWLGKNVLKERFLMINFDHLCETPKIEVDKIFTFLGYQINDIDLYNKVCRIPRKPLSVGRYKKFDVTCFPEQRLEEIRRLGFNIE